MLMNQSLFEKALDQALGNLTPVAVKGRVHEAIGTLIKVTGLNAKIGELCEVRLTGGKTLLAEVVGFQKQIAILSPYGSMQGISGTTEVLPLGRTHEVPVGYGLLGRILDGLGNPIDGGESVDDLPKTSVYKGAPHPLKRQMVNQPHETGVKCLDGLLTIGQGQRVGIFAPAGAGKSTLMGMLAKGKSSINVIALIGERGREVREFVEHALGPEGLERSVLVIATSDKSSVERAKCAYVATAIAEYFRDQGEQVLLMMDSLTRFARAIREIGLASGEPPTRRGFPPSVFAELPQLLERSGQGERGFITAFYTTLVEGEDDGSDPIAEEVRSILDGHIILSRAIAAKGIYPAIDVLGSASRVMTNVVNRDHVDAAVKFKSLMAKYNEVEFLLKIGEFKKGGDRLADVAVDNIAGIQAFLSQRTDELFDFQESLAQMSKIAAQV